VRTRIVDKEKGTNNEIGTEIKTMKDKKREGKRKEIVRTVHLQNNF
jgi:hypothetical protein